MRRSNSVDAEELLRRCGGVTPSVRRSYSVKCGGVTPSMRRSYSVGAEELSPSVRRSYSVGAEELLRRCGGVTPSVRRSSLRRCGGVTPRDGYSQTHTLRMKHRAQRSEKNCWRLTDNYKLSRALSLKK